MCNPVEYLKKRDKFPERLLRKVKKRRFITQTEYSTEKEILQAFGGGGFERMFEVLQKLFNLAI